MENIVRFLKDITDAEGLDYIWKNPFDVYKKSLEIGIESQDARILLFVLVNGVELKDFVFNVKGELPLVSQELRRRCLLQKTATDRFASILVSLYSNENMTDWETAHEAGFKNFCKMKWVLKWNGDARWKSDCGFVDSECSATATVKVVNKKKAYAAVEKILKENPFASEDELLKFFKSALKEVLDRDFFEYCTCDDYYQPYAEDYGGNYLSEVEDFCKQYGLKLLDYTCDAWSGDFEPYDHFDRYY